jgi:hypothetical protein
VTRRVTDRVDEFIARPQEQRRPRLGVRCLATRMTVLAIGFAVLELRSVGIWSVTAMLVALATACRQDRL